ncbi:MAG: cytochrome c [Halioglobus sp.]
MLKTSKSVAVIFLCAAASCASADDMTSGKALYDKNCAKCHDTGKMGAPVLNDMPEWADRSNILWSDVHEQHLDDGLLRDASKDPEGITAADMEAATNYMISIISKGQS